MQEYQDNSPLSFFVKSYDDGAPKLIEKLRTRLKFGAIGHPSMATFNIVELVGRPVSLLLAVEAHKAEDCPHLEAIDPQTITDVENLNHLEEECLNAFVRAMKTFTDSAREVNKQGLLGSQGFTQLLARETVFLKGYGYYLFVIVGMVNTFRLAQYSDVSIPKIELFRETDERATVGLGVKE